MSSIMALTIAALSFATTLAALALTPSALGHRVSTSRRSSASVISA